MQLFLRSRLFRRMPFLQCRDYVCSALCAEDPLLGAFCLWGFCFRLALLFSPSLPLRFCDGPATGSAHAPLFGSFNCGRRVTIPESPKFRDLGVYSLFL